MHEGLCWEFMILKLVVQMFVLGKDLVAAIEISVWQSCDWKFGIFTQQQLAQMISDMWTRFNLLL